MYLYRNSLSLHIFWVQKHKSGYIYISLYIYDLVPKGVQEKRTEVLQNKVYRMWMSNAFFEWTHVKSSTSEGRRQCCSSFLRNLTFSVFVTICWTLHITTSPHHCAANHAVNCENPTDLTRCDPHEYYQVNCCCSVSHRTACYAWFVAIDNVQHTDNLEHFQMNKKQHILKHKQLFFNITICDKGDLMIFCSQI